MSQCARTESSFVSRARARNLNSRREVQLKTSLSITFLPRDACSLRSLTGPPPNSLRLGRPVPEAVHQYMGGPWDLGVGASF